MGDSALHGLVVARVSEDAAFVDDDREAAADPMTQAEPHASWRVHAHDLNPHPVPKIADEFFCDRVGALRVLQDKRWRLSDLLPPKLLDGPIHERLCAGGAARLQDCREEAEELDLKGAVGHADESPRGAISLAGQLVRDAMTGPVKRDF